MKKLFVLIAALALITYGCKKDQPQPTNQLVDVSFSGKLLDRNTGTKDGDQCFSEIADLAVIGLDNGHTYTSEVFYLDGDPYTKSIKLEPGTYHVETFDLYIDVDHNGEVDATDGDAIASTPTDGAPYGSFVTDGVPIEFTVGAFTKMEIPIEVLCFEGYDYQNFGFFWYTYDEVIVRTQCFFGDLCVKHPADYETSLYAQQSGGLKMDMPAIMQIEVKRNGEQLKLVNNEGTLGETLPLCIEYPDLIGSDDDYEFVLSVLVKVGNTFQYVEFYTFTFSDDEMITAGADGVVDFVVGNCVLSDADFTFPPYMNLPETCWYKPTSPFYPGNLGASVDAEITGITGPYDLINGTYPSWCYEKNIDIYIGTNYEMDVYSSLYPNLMPTQLKNKDWSRANWIMNNLDLFPGYTWSEVQAAFWLLEDPSWLGGGVQYFPSYSFSNAQAIYSAAVAAVPNPATDPYAPPPGGWAAVAFVHATGDPVQAVFVLIDP